MTLPPRATINYRLALNEASCLPPIINHQCCSFPYLDLIHVDLLFVSSKKNNSLSNFSKKELTCITTPYLWNYTYSVCHSWPQRTMCLSLYSEGMHAFFFFSSSSLTHNSLFNSLFLFCLLPLFHFPSTNPFILFPVVYFVLMFYVLENTGIGDRKTKFLGIVCCRYAFLSDLEKTIFTG